MNLILAMAVAYLIGSVSPSIIAGKILKGIDVRDFGSGNAGSTNTFRVLGKKPGIVVLILDILKGFLAANLYIFFAVPAYMRPSIFAILCGVAAVAGHIWPVFFSFRGGKGVNTLAGVLLAVIPLEVALATVAFLAIFIPTGYVSLSVMLASLSLPFIALMRQYIFHETVPIEILIISYAVPLLMVYTHRTNIKRLLKGEESRSKLFRK